MTPEVVSKLEQAFLMGCTDDEACLFADIGRSTLFRYCDDNEGFRDRKEVLKQNPVLQARQVQMDDLADKNSMIAQKVLDRKEGSKVAVTGPDGAPLGINFFGVKPDGS